MSFPYDVAKLQVNAALMEDLQYPEEKLPQDLDPALGLFTVVESPGGGSGLFHLLCVDKSQKLVHYYPDPVSATGWGRLIVPLRTSEVGRVVQVVAVEHSGCILAFFIFEDRSYAALIWLAESQDWRPLTGDKPFGQVKALRYLSWTKINDDLILYGRSSASRSVHEIGIPTQVASQTESTFTLASRVAPSPPAPLTQEVFLWHYDQKGRTLNSVPLGTNPALATNGSLHSVPCNAFLCGYSVAGEGLFFCELRQDSGILNLHMSPLTINLNAQTRSAECNFALNPTVRVQLDAGDAFEQTGLLGEREIDGHLTFFLSTSLGQLVRVGTRYDEASKLWTDGESTKVVAGQGQPTAIGAVSLTFEQPSGDLAIFAIEKSTSCLWAGYNVAGATSLDWQRVGTKASNVATPSRSSTRYNVFTLNEASNVTMHHLSAVEGTWGASRITVCNSKASTIEHRTAFAYEVNAQDFKGRPVPHAKISVSGTGYGAVSVGSSTFLVSNGQSIDVVTDGRGRCSLKIEAQSISPPHIVFSVQKVSKQQALPKQSMGGKAVETRCVGDMIPGQAVDPAVKAPSTFAERLAGLDPSFQVNSTALKAAGLCTEADSNSDLLVKQLKALGLGITATGRNQALETPITVQLRRDATPGEGWSNSFGVDGVETRILSSSEVETLTSNSTRKRDVADWVAYGLAYFASSIPSIQIINFAVNGGLYVLSVNNEPFHLTTPQQIAQAIDIVLKSFSHYGTGSNDDPKVIEGKALDWLKVLFDWEDIFRTHKVLAASFNAFLGAVDDVCKGTEVLVSEKIDGWESTLRSYLEGAKAAAGIGQQQFGSLLDGAGPNKAFDAIHKPLNGGLVRPTYESHSVRANYVLNASQPHLERIQIANGAKTGQNSKLANSIGSASRYTTLPAAVPTAPRSVVSHPLSRTTETKWKEIRDPA